MLALVDRLDARITDVFRGVEIRLADAEGNDVLALALKCADFGQDNESVFGAEIVRSAGYCGHQGNSSGIKNEGFND
ncbi:MAG: hypothetical protein ACREEM_52810 [Blastocatellia bacterium]